ncbi:uncharacterized protein LOC127511088 isoform X5 [Ctenopharyngodon idella]|uniref:uncharacterized protein LOC127511088 isoform X1 n=1 Tax=Ctenopharyngodon idella TaxID=7959 RepID=UPI002232999A|nr:uncharacterized protein LOC127511088 isoform X1 [Ctenopharyngodon idella]XP_051747504.1 uncharacterized protein LOC127511088 isoform X3 [Ctenopharyngodon idella]XP_051747506.1 uncharacterized protein LOC127511088 isoform X4 [Ctenopharyngodon idella]XP_051747507.1 uncharacterized protein LOC127511088 isoform X5 [Ctenopharyngodon idella]
MAFIKVESEDMKIEETFRVKQDTEEQTKMVFIKEESEDMRIEETSRVKHEETEEQTGAKTGTEKTYKGRRQTTKLPTQKDCHACKEKIGVATKTCPHCGAKQPYKQKLEERKKHLAQEWKDRQKKNSSVNKVYDATELLLHKWDLLERYPVLLLARKTNKGFSAECFCPWQMNSEETQDAFVTIKRQYERLLNVVIADKLASSIGKTPAKNITKTKITPLENVCPSDPASESKPLITPESETLTPVSSSSASPVPSSFHSTQTPVVFCTTSLTPPVSLSVAPLSPLTHPDFISSQSSPVSSSLSSALPSAPTLSTCSKLTPVSIEQGTPDSESSSQRKKPTRRKEDTSGAKPGMEQTYKGRRPTTKLPTQKDCHTCMERIGVASKTCPHCGAKQPYKQKLEERKKHLAQGWKDRQKKNSSVNKVYDATELLLHKWDLLERYPVLLLARRSIKGFSAECICPWQMKSVKTQDAFVTIKRLYESLLNVVIADEPASSIGKTPATNITQTEITPLENVCPSDPASESKPLLTPESETLTPMPSSSASPVPSSFHSTQTPVVFCTTSLTPPVSLPVVPPLSPLTHPDFISSQSSPVSSSLSSALPSAPTLSTCSKLTHVSIEQGTPDSESSSRRKKRTRRKEDTCECPMHKDSTSFPYKKILRKRIREGHAEVLVQWYPCSGCGAKWENSWEPKENIED